LFDYPWESCVTMGTQWSFKPTTPKPTRDLIHLLVDVVAKGGNLLLNIGPQPDGRLPAEAMSRLRRSAIDGGQREAIHEPARLHLSRGPMCLHGS
jgi:alpha-L-fucosidase